MCCYSDKLASSPKDIGQAYLDGTACETNGKCYNGVCQGNTISGEISKWFADHKKIVIPVASVLGSLVVLAILFCCFRSMRRRMAYRGVAPGGKYPSPQLDQGGGWEPYPGGGRWGNEQQLRTQQQQHQQQRQPGASPLIPPPRASGVGGEQQMGTTQDWTPPPRMRYA